MQVHFSTDGTDDPATVAVMLTRLAAAFGGTAGAVTMASATRGPGRPRNTPAAPDSAPSPATPTVTATPAVPVVEEPDLLGDTGGGDDDLLSDMDGAIADAKPLTRDEKLSAIKTAATAKGVEWIRENAIKKYGVKTWADLSDDATNALHTELCS